MEKRPVKLYNVIFPFNIGLTQDLGFEGFIIRTFVIQFARHGNSFGFKLYTIARNTKKQRPEASASRRLSQ